MSEARCSWTTSVSPLGRTSTTGGGGSDPADAAGLVLAAQPASTMSAIARATDLQAEVIDVGPPRAMNEVADDITGRAEGRGHRTKVLCPGRPACRHGRWCRA